MRSILQLVLAICLVVNGCPSLIFPQEINSPKNDKSIFKLNTAGNFFRTNPESLLAANLVLNGEQSFNYFGYSVAAAGDVNGDNISDVIVGAPYYEVTFFGRAYIFFGGTDMNSTPDVTFIGSQVNGFLGWSVSSAGDVNNDGYSDVIVGEYGYANNVGRAYIYYGGASMNNTPDVTLSGPFQNYNFGISVSSAGDVNNDNFDDVIVGADGHNSNMGRAYLYLGGTSMNNAVDVTFTGEASSNYFGRRVSSAGDVNNDGYSDVIVGAYGYSSNTGRAYIYYGGASMNSIADVTLNGETQNSYFGFSVSPAGDVNNDNYSDVICGGYGHSSNKGKAYLYLGSANMNNVADLSFTGENSNDYFAISVSSAADVNLDGYDDVIIGAEGYNSYTGKSYLYYGGSGMNNQSDQTFNGELSNTYFGKSVSSASDVNNDGVPDLIMGANNYSSAKGRGYIFYSPLTPLGLNLKVIIEGFYDSLSNVSRLSDTVIVQLRNSSSPYSIYDSSQTVIDAVSQSGASSFAPASSGNFYIAVRHRNSIETWSSNPVAFAQGPPSNYDFTTASGKAYGNNQKFSDASPVEYSIYSGDVSRDGIIDLTDVTFVFNESNLFQSGYLQADVTGDNYVDLSDLTVTFNNSNEFVSAIKP